MRFSAWARFLVIFSLSIFLFFLTSVSAFAQDKATQNPPQGVIQTNYPAPNTNSNVPNNLHSWTQNVMIETMSALACQLSGIDPINPKQSCLGADVKTGKIGYLPKGDLNNRKIGGAIGGMNSMITVLFTPPLHASDYFHNLAQNFGVTKKTHAQAVGGVGFQGIIPLLKVWIAFRNIVYLLLVIIFVIIGLAIMLRIKIDPRTVMTIQNQIPKIIVGILAVTFSFAIAGFFIDLMWVFCYLMYNIISGINGVGNLTALNPTVLQGQPVIAAAAHIGDIYGLSNTVALNGSDILRQLLGIQPYSAQVATHSILGISTLIDLFTGVLNNYNNQPALNFNTVINLISDVIGWSAGIKVFSMNALNIDPAPGNIIGLLANAVLAGLAITAFDNISQYMLRDGIPYLLLYIIILIAILTSLFRLWFSLLITYIQILLDIVLAPFWIIGGIVPGSPISLSGWIRDLSANLLAFPAVITMFLLGRVFVDAFSASPANAFVPPLIGDPGNAELLGALISLGILLITPNIIGKLKEMLKAPKNGIMGGVMAGLAPGAAVPGRVTGGMSRLAFGTSLNPKGFLNKSGQGVIGTVGRAFGLLPNQ
jgi:hypothetical protein